jgi:hypothetical protein
VKSLHDTRLVQYVGEFFRLPHPDFLPQLWIEGVGSDQNWMCIFNLTSVPQKRSLFLMGFE